MVDPIPETCAAAEPFALRVTDDSMSPEFWEGCIVIVDPTGHARDGAHVVTELEPGCLVLRTLRHDSHRRYRLEPIDPRFETVELPDGLVRVRGVVVQRAGRRRRHHKRYE